MEQVSPLITYKITVQYNGKNYFGWQIQKDVPTIQGQLESALARICKDCSFRTLGASRTDKGVHALAQVCRIDFPEERKLADLQYSLNSLLPQDIRIIDFEKCAEDFHPIFHAKKKTYDYIFSFSGKENCFQADFFGHCLYDLDINLLQEACKVVIGEHDFVNYFCTGSDVPTTIRTIFDCEIEKLENHSYLGVLIPEAYRIRISGNGFRKQMVRLLVGAMWNVARGEVSLDQLQESLNGVKKAERLGPVAPASGLYLREIEY